MTPATLSAPTLPGVAAFAARPRRRMGWYWPCQAAGWLAVALLNIGFSFPAKPGQVALFAAIALWGSLCGVLLSHGWRAFLRSRDWLGGARRTPWGKLAAGIVALGFIQVMLVAAAFGLARLPGAFTGWGWFPPALLFWIFIMLMWTTMYATVASIRRARRFESEALRLEILAKDAELRALQAQVNPHFFFNSLNSVRALIFESPPAAAQMVDQLATLMRHALRCGAAPTIALGQEIEAVNAYLAIEKIRFEERLRPTISIQAGLEALPIPPMALQTLVENAVKYGVEQRPEGCEIRVTVVRSGGMVHIDVINQGALMPFENSTRVGIDNTRKRLLAACGAGAALNLVARDGWVRAELRLPEPA